MQSLNDYENWVFQNPDPDLLINYTDPECACFEEERARIQEFVDNGWRARADAGDLTMIEVVGRPAPGVALITAVFVAEDGVIVDQEGDVVNENELPPPTRVSIGLTMRDGVWRNSSLTILDPV